MTTSAAKRRWPLGPAWWGLVLVPATILLHESAHLAVLAAAGIDSLSLHHSSAGFAGQPEFWRHLRAGEVAAASQIAPPVIGGLMSLTAIAVSWSLAAAGLWGVVKRGSPTMLALALAASSRLPLVFLLFALGRSEHTDEAHTALTLGVPESILMTIGLMLTIAVVVAGWRVLRTGRRSVVWSAVAGVVVGVPLWSGVLGPLLLP